MRDGLALRQLARSTFRIDVNPLIIGGRLCELINSVLIDDDPILQPNLLALKCFRIINRRDKSRHASPLNI